MKGLLTSCKDIDLQLMKANSTKLKPTLFITVLVPLFTFAQISRPGDLHEPINKFGDSTSLSLYTSLQQVKDDGLDLSDIYFKLSNNSKYARGYNDGAVWKGKGLTAEFHLGFSGKTGKLSYYFNPVIFYSHNNQYFIPNLQPSTNRYAYPYSTRIDWVQRYGDSSFTEFHLGQSEIRLDIGKFVSAIGTQNYSLGPSIYNPILLSRQGGGFPHFRLGFKPNFLTSRKNIAKVEANLIYGLLNESEYFDTDSDNDNRFFNGLFVALTPSFLPELTLGFNKVLYKQTRFFESEDIFSTFFIVDDGVVDGDTLSPNDAFDQMASLTLEWNFREIGFRAYAEFAKNDFTSGGAGLRPTAVEPEHSRGYTIGFEKKLTTQKEKEVTITYEHTNLSIGHTAWRPTPPFFAHGVNRQGYTQDGQIIGAGIGPGGNSDHLGIRVINEKLSGFFLLQRIERDRDYFVNQVRNPNLHDIEYSLTAAGQIQYDQYDLFGEITLSHNYGRNFTFNDQGNVNIGVGGRWKF